MVSVSNCKANGPAHLLKFTLQTSLNPHLTYMMLDWPAAVAEAPCARTARSPPSYKLQGLGVWVLGQGNSFSAQVHPCQAVFSTTVGPAYLIVI